MPRQAEANGAVLVAKRDSDFAGLIAGWIERLKNIAETPDSNRFDYIPDIRVMPAFRGQRIAARLPEEIEQYFHRAGVTRLRISVLAVNTSVRTRYEHARSTPYEILYEKRVSSENDV